MSEEILRELNAEGLRSVFLKYTREAYESIPKMDKPSILDIGCGTGMPTLELARLSNGEITGIDVDQGVLDNLNLKIKQQGLSGRIKVYNRSVYNTQFEDEIFDIIWEEGVIHLLDLKKALKECNRVLKLNGFIVTGEATNWANRKLKHFPRFGFKLTKQIPWEKECWWMEYYKPLEEKINILRKKYDNLDKIEEVKRHVMEIEMVKKDPTEFDCVTYILQKIN
ncbi:MAG: class I SAM-dependent methyltransferase [Candidatus Lokiarchaeota archaeon]|nr:class I SAM-dependent methyltransferase [Candidatus Lokiarchaeota archaeon]